jgi:hypothetical protein
MSPPIWSKAVRIPALLFPHVACQLNQVARKFAPPIPAIFQTQLTQDVGLDEPASP